MDMWGPFINAVRSHFERAEELIAFDRFHVSGHFGKALNKVRASEHRELSVSSPLARSKYHWLRNSERTDNCSIRRKEFLHLTRLNLKTSRAWRIKEAAAMLWDYTYMGVARKEWTKLMDWISRCWLEPMMKVGKMIKRYFWGIRCNTSKSEQ